MEKHWLNLITLFDCPDEIRRVIYTTNAIESLNGVIRKAVNNRKVFPHDQSALNIVYLAINAAAKAYCFITDTAYTRNTLIFLVHLNIYSIYCNLKRSKKWTMPIRNCKPVLNRFMIEFPERMQEIMQMGSYTELFTGSTSGFIKQRPVPDRRSS